MEAATQAQNNLSPASEGRTPSLTPHSPGWATEDVVEAAGDLLDAARGLVAEIDQMADQPRSIAAARQLLGTCADLFLAAQEVE